MNYFKVKMVAVAFLIFATFTMWLLFYPANKNEADPENTTSGSLQENALLEGVNEIDQKVAPKVVVQEKEEASVEEPILSEADIIKLNDSVNSLQSELSALSVDLNENLENPEKRKQIEEQYLRLTEEYNKALIALVKSKQVSSAVSE